MKDFLGEIVPVSEMESIRNQLRNNAVAIVSIFIAVSSLGYNTWRNETTEEQRNVRHAAFRVLESLGELQEVVDTRYYYLPFNSAHASEGETRIRGFGIVAMVSDLTGLMPHPANEQGAQLHSAWNEHFVVLDQLTDDGGHTPAAKAAEEQLTRGIDATRAAVLDVLNGLE
jgi:hypothetical protein